MPRPDRRSAAQSSKDPGPRVLEGHIEAEGKTFAIVVSRFNSFLSEKLLQGALDCLIRHNADPKSITVAHVPGAFEVPQACLKLGRSGEYNAVIALGVVIRGATPHFEYVAGESAKGLAAVGLETGVPMIYGVVTADTIEQAIERSGTKAGNKGWDAAMSAMEMADLLPRLGT